MRNPAQRPVNKRRWIVGSETPELEALRYANTYAPWQSEALHWASHARKSLGTEAEAEELWSVITMKCSWWRMSVGKSDSGAISGGAMTEAIGAFLI